MQDVHSYMENDTERRALCLFGLRRTGKTVMMCQEIQNIGEYANTILLECEKDDTMRDIREELKKYPNCKYIFLDEVTKARNFIDTCSFLADHMAAVGKRVVLAGTDSLGFLLAKNNELYDRVNFIHTTYIPFKEYNYLLGKDFMEYMQHGGTLTDGKVFYNKEQTAEYTNTAITYNIIHGLEHWNAGVNYGTKILREIMDKNELPSFINKVIEWPERQFVARIINQAFRSHDLGSLQDLMTRHDIGDPKALDELYDRVRIFLGIKEKHFNQADEQSVDVIIEYLKKLDVLYQVPETDEFIFTQPGMRYSQTTDITEALVTSDVFKDFSKQEQQQILEKLETDICGKLMEDIIFYELSRYADSLQENSRNMKIDKYRNIFGGEIDILVTDTSKHTSFAIEVKLSDTQTEKQGQHLQNQELCQEIEKKFGTKIINKAVVYRGENSDAKESGILYLNVEDFLRNTEKMLEILLQKEKIHQVSELLTPDLLAQEYLDAIENKVQDESTEEIGSTDDYEPEW